MRDAEISVQVRPEQRGDEVRCARTGCQAVAVIGHPEYYPRFGFRPRTTYGLRSEFPVPDDLFMIAELVVGVLAARRGFVRYTPEFHVEEDQRR
jgi:putative acetyltransferase